MAYTFTFVVVAFSWYINLCAWPSCFILFRSWFKVYVGVVDGRSTRDGKIYAECQTFDQVYLIWLAVYRRNGAALRGDAWRMPIEYDRTRRDIYRFKTKRNVGKCKEFAAAVASGHHYRYRVFAWKMTLLQTTSQRRVKVDGCCRLQQRECVGPYVYANNLSRKCSVSSRPPKTGGNSNVQGGRSMGAIKGVGFGAVPPEKFLKFGNKY